MPVHARTTLPVSVSTPATARAFARDAVQQAQATERAEDLTLLVSELVTNAVVGGSENVVIDLTVDPAASHVEVVAGSANGTLVDHGLVLVSRLATKWGVRPAERGTAIWADLT